MIHLNQVNKYYHKKLVLNIPELKLEIAMIVRQLYVLSVLFFLLAVIIFFRRYYRFEPRQINVIQ